jgi:hypothetical protein
VRVGGGGVNPFRLLIVETGFYLVMDANTTLEKVRHLAQLRLLERALAARILAVIDGKPDDDSLPAEPVEEEMVMSLGRT